MPASEELIVAREQLESFLDQLIGVNGLDIGFRDEDARDPDDLAIRLFIEDELETPQEVLDLVDSLGVPFVVVQRRFEITALPDQSRYRPVVGGVSTASARRTTDTGVVHAGTLGAIARTDRTDPPLVVGLSNHHVLAGDANRNFGDAVSQPEPGPLGVIPSDQVGQLVSWSFPEVVFEGIADAAVCTVDPGSATEIHEIGTVAGTGAPTLGMLVRKRGRTTGLTHGIVTTDTDSGLLGTYYVDYPSLPPVNHPVVGQPTIRRKMANQVMLMADFPQSIVFGESGDSGSVVVDSDNRIVGLYYGGAHREPGDPLRFGIMTPIDTIVQELGLEFT